MARDKSKMGAESALWLALIVWVIFTLVPIIQAAWIRYQWWVIVRFGALEVTCPRCGGKKLMYNSNLCFDCYYRSLGEAKRESE